MLYVKETTDSEKQAKKKLNEINSIGFIFCGTLTAVNILVNILNGKKKTKGAIISRVLASLLSNLSWQYWFTFRPLMARWGAKKAEIKTELPGDELIPAPRVLSTRAITIKAPPEKIWAWLVQMGQGKGGLYSYEWLENLIGYDMHNAAEINPNWQTLKVGDFIRAIPPEKGEIGWTVQKIEPPTNLVLRSPGTPEENFKKGLADFVWIFALKPLAETSTRLIIRARSDYHPDFKGKFFNQIMLEPIHFLMEEKMLRSIKQRAEKMSN
jgi:hypothetical protein